jgi:hypothetical protein
MVGKGIKVAVRTGQKKPTLVNEQIINSIESIEVKNNTEGRDVFKITFKIGRRGQGDYSDYNLIKDEFFKPFNRVQLTLIINSSENILIDGLVTLQELNPSISPRESSFSIFGEDISLVMDLKEQYVNYEDQSHSSIARTIISSYSAYGLKENVVLPAIEQTPSSSERIHSQLSTHWIYLNDIAKLYDFIFFTEPTETLGTDRTYWGPLNLAGKIQQPLSFNNGPQTNVHSINVRNDPLKPTTIGGTFQEPFTGEPREINIKDSKRINLSKNPSLTSFEDYTRLQLLRGSGLTHAQWMAKAQSQVDCSTSAITVTGELNVFRYGTILRARNRVELGGVGDTYHGMYYVTNVTHSISREKYSQNFVLTREGVGSKSKSSTSNSVNAIGK